ncbi:MAG: GntR family transcriptional regulator [Steroidobacteraceae bacterium]
MTETPGYRPLYRQVYDIVVSKVAKGAWRVGESLPSELNLAKELGVSQGTVRKVLDALTAEKLLERRQGKGTYVAENTQERSLFRFFRLARPGGKRLTPERAAASVKVRSARNAERSKLDLDRTERVVEISRTRHIDGSPTIYETIVLPANLFPGIEKRAELPNTLYSLYQTEFGINIVSAQEEVRAELATAEDHRRLQLEVGAPILVIDRLALSLQERKVEWRISRVKSHDLVYAVTLT